MADVCYQLTNNPIILEDLGFNYLYSVGLDAELAKQYSNQLKTIVKNNQNKAMQTKLNELIDNQQVVEMEQSNQHKRLIAPMISKGRW